MAPLWGLFNLGAIEMLVLAVLCLGVPLVVVLVVLIVVMATRQPRDRENE
jgi:hypothetical protein